MSTPDAEPSDTEQPLLPAAPVSELPREPDEDIQKPEAGIALSLSGGGNRAAFFHVGAILRLNECGLLPKLKRISSVSGGSITAAVLGLNWSRLRFDSKGVCPRKDIDKHLIKPIRTIGSTTIDVGAIAGGIFLPGTISDRIAAAYDEYLFGQATLQDLPSDSAGPRFVINATSVQTGALVRFSKPYLADYKIGRILAPQIPLARAVAASSAFPPFLSPVTIDVNPDDFEVDLNAPLQHPPFTDELVLTDGGVYDNLGLETTWKRYQTILVSDGGGQMEAIGEPDHDWARHSKRILEIIDQQVRNLRKRQLIASYLAPEGDVHHRRGTYWGIRSDIRKYTTQNGPPIILDCPYQKTEALAKTPTRLKRIPTSLQNRIMNWGYAITDMALRRHAPEILPSSVFTPVFPFDGGIG